VATIIACGQFSPAPGDAARNIECMEAHAREAARQGARLLLLPELCLCGYPAPDEAARFAVSIDGPEIGQLRQHARAAGISLCFGFVEREQGGALRNSMAFVDAAGELRATYRKVHLWKSEAAWATPGTRFESFDAGIARAGMWICYDTRFPEAPRALALAGATLGLVGAAWFGPEEEWELALRARALDNGIFVAGAAVQGAFGSQPFHGTCLIADPHGRVLARGRPGWDEIVTAAYDEADVKAFRARLPLLDDRRPQSYA
jgi:predicted amidohydrolase